MKTRIIRAANYLEVQTWGKTVLISALIGLVAGAGAIAFKLVLHALEDLSINRVLALEASPAKVLLILLVPAFGGLLSGLLTWKFAPEAEGHGTDSMIRAFHRLGGKIRTRVPFIKTLASACNIGTGGSAGEEGPIAQIGAGLASIVATRLGLDSQQRRIFMLAGCSAGVGAIFRAPLGGALFSAEVLYKDADFEYEAVIPSVIASILAYAVFTSYFGFGYLFAGVAGLRLESLKLLPLFIPLALLCTACGFLYVRFFYGSRDFFFKKLGLPSWLRPALGGLLVGAMALCLPEVLGHGYHFMQAALNGTLALPAGAVPAESAGRLWQFMLLLALAKMVAVSFTISSGGSGGVFGPSLFIGSMISGAYAYFLVWLAPGLIGPDTVKAMILVGMAGFFAGVAKVPIASMLMVTELTGSYELIVPLMLTCIITVMTSRRWTLYEEQLNTRLDSPAHLGDFVVNVLEDVKVRQIYHPNDAQYKTLREDTRLSEIADLVRDSFQTFYPVLDREGRLNGIVSLRDIQEVLADELLGNVVLASEISRPQVTVITPEDNLYEAMRRMAQSDYESLPVVDSLDRTRLLGVLNRRDIILGYDKRLRNLRDETGAAQAAEAQGGAGYRGDNLLMELTVLASHHKLAEQRVRDAEFPKDTLLCAIQRGRDSTIPNGDTKIAVGDRLLILVKRDREAAVRRALTE